MPNHRRPGSSLRLPTSYSKEFPIEGGHSYLLRGIPKAIWDAAMDRADEEDRSIRDIAIRMMKYYAKHGVPPEVDGPTDAAKARKPRGNNVASRRRRKS